MTTALRCPTCSAPLDPPRPGTRTVACPYCGANAVLTERLGAFEARASGERHTGDVAEVVQLLRAGRKIEAIEVYRARFGVGLHAAKEAIERIEAVQPAGAVPVPAASGVRLGLGWMGVVLLIVGVGVALIVWGAEAGIAEENAPGVTEKPSPWAALTPGDEPEAGGFAEEVLRFGSEGTGAGRFTDARSVAVDGEGRLYVAEYDGGRVQVFDSLGIFLTQWMADPEAPLTDLEADRDGAVYVVQSGRIRRYEGATGEMLGELRSRTAYLDVAVALDASLWAVAFPYTLVHLDRDGGVLRTIDAREAIDGDAMPEHVAVSGTGDLYVSDRRTGLIYRLDASGRFVDRFSRESDRPAALNSPQDLALDGRGRLYASDLGSGISVFDADGRFLGAFGGNAVVFGLAFNDRDELFAAYRNDHQIVKFRPRR